MGNEKTKYVEQEILNYSTDDTVNPPLLTVGQRYWTGTAWAKVTSNGGGGTEYADGTARGTATGTLAMGDDGTNIQSLSCDNTGKLNINISSPGTSATSLGKAEDAPHTTGDVGVMALGVRNDSGSVLAADGDYVPLTLDATGALRVDLNGTVSANNSSVVALAGGASFTGTSDDCINYNEIRISVIASHASATDGLSIQQSSDGTNWDITDTYTIPATTGKTYSVPRQARYMRVVYTNGATLQTSFRLQTILNRIGARVSSQRAGDAYTNETDLEQNQVFPMGYNGATWDRLRATIANGLAVDVTRLSALVAGSALIGKVGIDQTTIGTTNGVSIVPATSGGLLTAMMTSADGSTALTNTAQAIKASAGQLFGWYIYNPNSSAVYVSLYNTAAASVTVGTTNPQNSFCIPATSAANCLGEIGITFSNAGWSAAATTTGGGNTAPASALEANFFYK